MNRSKIVVAVLATFSVMALSLGCQTKERVDTAPKELVELWESNITLPPSIVETNDVGGKAPTYDNDRIYIAQTITQPDVPGWSPLNSVITALDRTTGDEVWQWQGEGQWITGFEEPAKLKHVDNRFIVATVQSDDVPYLLLVLDALTGNEVWSQELDHELNGYLSYVGDNPAIWQQAGDEVNAYMLDVRSGAKAKTLVNHGDMVPYGTGGLPSLGEVEVRDQSTYFQLEAQESGADSWEYRLGDGEWGTWPASHYDDDSLLLTYSNHEDETPVYRYVLLDRKTGTALGQPASFKSGDESVGFVGDQTILIQSAYLEDGVRLTAKTVSQNTEGQ